MKDIKTKKPNNSENFTIIGKGMPPKNSPQMTAANIAFKKKFDKIRRFKLLNNYVWEKLKSYWHFL